MLPFSWRCEAGRDDADDFDRFPAFVILRDRVGDQKHGDAMHHSDRLPAFFPALDPVLTGQTERVGKDMRCIFEGGPVMLSLIETVLDLVPSAVCLRLKLQKCRY